MITIAQLKELAVKAEAEIGAAAHQFVAFIEKELGIATAAPADAAAATSTTADAAPAAAGGDPTAP